MALCERPGVTPPVSLAALFEGSASIEGSTSWGLREYAQAIASSGLPALQDLPAFVRNQQLDSYLRRIVDRELPEQGYRVRDTNQLQAWMRCYAAATATQASYSEILDGATPHESTKPSKKAMSKYREKLSEIWILDPLPAWNFAAHPFPRIAQEGAIIPIEVTFKHTPSADDARHLL